MRHGAVLENDCWRMKWDVRGDGDSWWVQVVTGTQSRCGCRRQRVSRSSDAGSCQEATRCVRVVDAGIQVETLLGHDVEWTRWPVGCSLGAGGRWDVTGHV